MQQLQCVKWRQNAQEYNENPFTYTRIYLYTSDVQLHPDTVQDTPA